MTRDLFQSGLFAPEGVAFVRVPERARRVWLWTLMGFTLLIATLAAFIVGLVVLIVAVKHDGGAEVSPYYWRAWLLWTGRVWILVATGAFFLSTRQRRHWLIYGYCLDDEQLWIRGGLFNREISVIPYGRVQVVSVSSGPLQRRLKLATLRVHTATGDDLSLECLDQEDAAILREQLSNQVLSRGVEL